MAGEPRARVKELLTEELLVENLRYNSRWFLVELTSPSGVIVTTARSDDRTMAGALAIAIGHCGWRPWGGVTADLEPLPLHELPDGPRDIAMERDWRRVSVAPVHLDGALVAAAKRDALTGLANRDAFADALADSADVATLLYIDIDRFKAVNDHHGHDVGDRALVEVARRIVVACRPGDIVARFGGDEFVVLLNGVDIDQGQVIGERIVDAVAAPLEGVTEIVQLTVSVGLAPVVRRDDAVNAADIAMLQAKRAGRSRVVTSDVR